MTGAVAAALAAVLAAAPPAAAPATPATLRVRVMARNQATEVVATAMAVRCDGLPRLPGLRFTVAGAKLQIEKGPACDLIELEGAEIRTGEARRGYRGVVKARARDGIVELVNEVPLEEYLASVVGGETVTDQAPALEAQAVVSRTFALASRGRHAGDGFDLCDLAHCQVYPGVLAEDEASRKAVEATRGQVLKRKGALAPAWFHSSCGGATSSARDVFGEGAAGEGEGVGDLDEHGKPLCAASPDAAWTFSIARDELARALGLPAQGRALEVARKDRAGRIVEVRAFGARMSGEELQSKVGRAVGWHKLKSLLAEVDDSGGSVRFRGRGLGHGVGLCQWGAAALAKKGKGYREILGKYFPGARIDR
ncbi:MAG TPA: SpoIID/LytB domain-containing protein [Myxococcales bacterium]